MGAADRISGASALDESLWHRALQSVANIRRMRFYGGGRFDSEAECGPEWKHFGGALFFLWGAVPVTARRAGSSMAEWQ